MDEVDQIEWGFIGLCETYRRLSEVRGGYWMHEIGRTEDNPEAEGLAFPIHPKMTACVPDFKTE